MLSYLALHRTRLSEHPDSHRNLVVSYTTFSPFPSTYLQSPIFRHRKQVLGSLFLWSWLPVTGTSCQEVSCPLVFGLSFQHLLWLMMCFLPKQVLGRHFIFFDNTYFSISLGTNILPQFSQLRIFFPSLISITSCGLI